MYRSSDPNALVTISKGTVKSGPFLGLLGLWARGVVELGLLVNPATRLEALPVLDSEVVAFGVDTVIKSNTQHCETLFNKTSAPWKQGQTHMWSFVNSWILCKLKKGTIG